MQSIRIHGESLEGNLEGDSPDRDVSVYLPASYWAGERRYPVLYLLHGFNETNERWFGSGEGSLKVQSIADRLMGQGLAQEMILVMPDAYTVYHGSMYSNSVTTGNWEDFIARDLVSYIDAHFRTQALVTARGLAGHSMGGYGALRVGMKNPDTFSSIYLLSPCCLADDNLVQSVGGSSAEAIKNMEDLQRADAGTIAILARAAAWSPNPQNPPLFLDLPRRAGQIRPEVATQWAANSPMNMLARYKVNLKRLHIAFDVGLRDRHVGFRAVLFLHEALDEFGIDHAFETFDGGHTDYLAERIETRILPFFSEVLDIRK